MDREHTPEDELSPTGVAPEPAEAPEVDASLVEDLLRAISTALRNYRLYSGQSATLERFVEAARNKLVALWEHTSQVKLEIEEQSIRFQDESVFPSGGESGELAFLFYKDGIRTLTFRPGFEDELLAFVAVLANASHLRAEEDDLITLLWQADLSHLRYEYVELSADEVEVSTGTPNTGQPITPQAIREEAEDPERGLSPEDFKETLYFLDEAEMRRLADEVRLELARDVWADVVAALFDRLEDGKEERKLRILGYLSELLASALGAGRLDRAAGLLRELAELSARPGLFSSEVLREVRALFEQLARGETIRQLALSLEANPEALRSDALAALVGFFPPRALAPLMRAAEAVTRPDVRRTFEQAIQRLAVENSEEVVALLQDPDPGVVAGAVRWVGRLGAGSATNELIGMLGRRETPVRLAAIEALQELRAAAAGRVLQNLLEDGDRDVRLAAVRALGVLDYAAARPVLEAAIASKRLRAADRTEKIAFFESYGRLAGADGVALLDRTLNGKSWLGRGEPPEIRACAALGLGRARHPAARTALNAAANDPDPVVRSAVARALRGEESS